MTSTGGGRIDSLDALRGFAIFGILLINIQVFSGWGFVALETRQQLPWSEWDQTVATWLDILVRAKFYSLFSLLFGYSFMMLVQRVEQNPVRYHLRRMVGLLVVGTAHSVLFSPWDILMLYAVMGMCLGALLNVSASILAAGGFGLLVITGVALWFSPQLGLAGLDNGLGGRLLQENVPALSGGSYAEVVNANIRLSVSVFLDRIENLRPLRVLAMFLLGAAAARLRLAERGSGHIGLLVAAALVGLVIGTGLAWVEVSVDAETARQEMLALSAEVAAPPLVAIGYGALLLLWWRGDGLLARSVRSAFAPAGRMAMTNYILQSVVCISIFYGFGGDRFASLSLAALMVFSLALFMVQLMVSAAWLRLFTQGPLEWLWRWQVKGTRPRLFRA
ncbi:DUF418 domain-containing protein [Marinobacter sp.]|uniref:DUF418 domain-containing protein n=1 Tax=Marinobacter sp. TaxID=50741 RepID=UPI003566E510